MYSETCINQSFPEGETLLRRTDTFDLVCFVYASLSRISKAKTVERTLLQTNKFFQSSDKKVNCFTQLTLKKTFFYNLKQQFFLSSFCSFEGVQYFWVKLYLFSQDTLWNQPVVLHHRNWYWTGTFKPYSTPLWTIGFKTVTCIELWWSVQYLQNNALKI